MVDNSPDGRLRLKRRESGGDETNDGEYDHPKDAFPIDFSDPLLLHFKVQTGLVRIWLLHRVIHKP